jgi:hypothetical protein
MTHEYTILTGGIITAASGVAGAGGRDTGATAIAWAAGIVLAVGDDATVLTISRGDSRIVDLRGATVQPLNAATLEPGDPADFEIRDGTAATPVAVVRGGHVVEGAFPGLERR